MYELTVRSEFEAAHRLIGYEGKCRRLHGHNWTVEAVVKGRELDRLGMVLDFKVIRAALLDVLNKFDHRYLNDLEPFDSINPTAENLARVIFERLSKSPIFEESSARLSAIKIFETPRSCVSYSPDD